jgi:outer membrane protein OmpA-like peptidoglycan-associated protein
MSTLTTIFFLSMVLALTACVDMTPVNGHALSSTREQRFSDAVISRDWQDIDAMRQRIATLTNRAVSVYAITRADAMTEFGAEEYAETDATGVIEAALDDGLRMLSSQERMNKTPDMTIPQMPGVLLIRQDLWDKTGRIKKDPVKFNCVQQQLARLEVGLIELAHEHYEVVQKLNTEDHVRPYHNLVNILNEDLDDALQRCHAKPVVKYIFAADALFAFDKSDVKDILETGRQKLQEFAKDILTNQQQWQQIIITGHTDRLGGHEYNLLLGQKRADSIKDYLVANYSVAANRIKTRSMGYVQPVVYCAGEQKTDALIACLQPNRRVEIEVR